MNFFKKIITSEDIGKVALFPCDRKYELIILKLDEGEVISADIHQTRNYQQLKMFWAICRAVADNFREEKFRDLDTARKVAEYVKLKLGYVDYRIVIADRTHIRTKSISYAKMTQEQFQKFLNDAIQVLETIGSVKASNIQIHEYDGEIEDDR